MSKGLSEQDLKKFKEIYNINCKIELEYQDKFNKFLIDKGINEEQFYQIVTNIINDRYDEDIKKSKRINNRYK